MTASQGGAEDEPFVPRRLRDPAEDPPPPPRPPMNRWVRVLLLVLLFTVMAAVLGVSLRGMRFSSPSSDQESARCVDTSSQRSDGTHLVVDGRNCESGGDEDDRRYRWESSGSSRDLDRGILELIRESLDGRR
ncbi:hypothetical protein HS041_01170 [Planomonospora sp. ID67723]|uniref:hypothetical protein n=1 Tax=Planomonospora sp. ID67723 TaxID=2738134 RepID=UPI0018C41E7F|nr:hypothetical protein [Planomonospora sp. ID67723]MBG0826393.1 hypothetical protein [Planomonospora sp. ID67723]